MTDEEKLVMLRKDYDEAAAMFQCARMWNVAGKTPEELVEIDLEYRRLELHMMEAMRVYRSAVDRVARGLPVVALDTPGRGM